MFSQLGIQVGVRSRTQVYCKPQNFHIVFFAIFSNAVSNKINVELDGREFFSSYLGPRKSLQLLVQTQKISWFKDLGGRGGGWRVDLWRESPRGVEVGIRPNFECRSSLNRTLVLNHTRMSHKFLCYLWMDIKGTTRMSHLPFMTTNLFRIYHN
jgi:hypothetical protein